VNGAGVLWTFVDAIKAKKECLEAASAVVILMGKIISKISAVVILMGKIISKISNICKFILKIHNLFFAPFLIDLLDHFFISKKIIKKDKKEWINYLKVKYIK
jgi:hypothetical protein